MKTLLLVTLALLMTFGTAHPAFAAGDPKAELKALVAKIQVKMKAGKRAEKDLAENFREFDALLAAHAGDQSDEVAAILFTKAALYTQVLNNHEKAILALRQLKADFPRSKPAGRADALIASLEAKLAVATELALGRPFPDFAEVDLEGRPLSIANYRGKVVLIDFWAMWCGPCLAELPKVIATYNKFHPQGFEIVGISLDRAGEAEKLKRFVLQRKMPWPQYFDGKYWENKLSRRYGIRSIPATILLDREGKIIARDLRGRALEEAVAKALAR